ncbi:MAG TPA: hypothetical protein VJH22_05890 [Candidatus Nanoarchaeia archaeon]|nr:hypothetical protein [Candidatus Nanoarchaeia archaeon]
MAWSEHTIYGDKINDDAEPLIEEGINHDLIEGKLVYARACSCAASLGRACVTKSGCFIGYKYPFQWYTDRNREGNPSKDGVARLFLGPTNSLAEGLIRGKTAKESAKMFINESRKSMLQILRKKDEPGTMASLHLIWSNV